MRKLSYFILGIIILLVAIFVITPYFTGSQIQKHVMQHIAKLEHQNPNMSVKINEYNRHWFSSDVNFTLSYRMPFIFNGLSPSKPISLTLNAHVDHGPIISYTVDSKKHHELGKSAVVLTSPQMQGEIISIMNWQHNIHTVFEVEQFTNKAGPASITIKDINGYVNFNHAAKRLDYDIKVGHFENVKDLVPGIRDDISTTNSELKGSATKQDGLWIGKTTLKREDTNITRNNTPALNIKDLSGTINSHIIDHRASYQMHASAADLTLAGQQLGALSYSTSLNNADAKALGQLISAAKRFYLHGNVSLSSLTDIYSPIFTLIEKGLTLNIQNFTLNLPDSNPIKLTASLQFIAAPQGVNFLNALKYMSANAKLSLPREFVVQQLTEFYQDMLTKSNAKGTRSASARAQQTLQQWIHNQMFTSDNGSLTSIISIKEGEVLVNGKKPKFEIENSE